MGDVTGFDGKLELEDRREDWVGIEGLFSELRLGLLFGWVGVDANDELSWDTCTCDCDWESEACCDFNRKCWYGWYNEIE